ncbi:MAG: threonine/serine dehydratase [Balneolaceae bacterium]|nr:threonine/serine dehydratase [Balneolaceae bacterium]
MPPITHRDVIDATERTAGALVRTPVIESRELNARFADAGVKDARVLLKCENVQHTGSFKYRGAMNACLCLTSQEQQMGVATHSSGNHGRALATVARSLDIPCTVVVPSNASPTKVDAIRATGATIIESGPTLDARESTLADVVATNPMTVVPPYNHPHVMAGQGTCAVEFVEQLQEFDTILDVITAPVGGGGLLSGVATWMLHESPSTTILGSEPALAGDAADSFNSGTLQPPMPPKTIADGLRTGLGSLPFDVIQKRVHDICTTSEEAIIRAMRLVWETARIVIEPSCAVPIAALLEGRRSNGSPVDLQAFSGKSIGVIITGGNVNLDNLPWERKRS